MPKSWSSEEIIRRLREHGFERVGQRGSHVKLRDRNGRTLVVQHPRRDVPKGTLGSIRRQSGVDFD